jgi:hypothetical protein
LGGLESTDLGFRAPGGFSTAYTNLIKARSNVIDAMMTKFIMLLAKWVSSPLSHIGRQSLMYCHVPSGIIMNGKERLMKNGFLMAAYLQMMMDI